MAAARGSRRRATKEDPVVKKKLSVKVVSETGGVSPVSPGGGFLSPDPGEEEDFALGPMPKVRSGTKTKGGKKGSYKPRKASIQVLFDQVAGYSTPGGGSAGYSSAESTPLAGRVNPSMSRTTSLGYAARSDTRTMSYYKSSREELDTAGWRDHMNILSQELKYAARDIPNLKLLQIKVKSQFDMVTGVTKSSSKDAKAKRKAMEYGLDWHLANEIIGELSTLCVAQNAELQDLEMFKADVREEIGGLVSQLEEMEHDKEVMQVDLEEVRVQNEQMILELERYETMAADMAKASQSSSEHASAMERQHKRLEALEQDLRESEKERSELSEKLEKVESELKFIKDDYEFASQSAHQGASEVESLQRNLLTLKDQLSKSEIKADQELTVAQRKFQDMEKKYQRHIAELEQQLRETEHQLVTTSSSIAIQDQVEDEIVMVDRSGMDSPGVGASGVSYVDGFDGAGHAGMMSLDAAMYEYSDDDWLDGEEDDDEEPPMFMDVTMEFETEKTYLEGSPLPKSPLEDTLTYEKGMAIDMSVQEESPKPQPEPEPFVTEKIGLSVVHEPFTPDLPAVEQPVLDLTCFDERGPIISEPHLLNYLNDKPKTPEPVVVVEPEKPPTPEPVEPEPEPEPEPPKPQPPKPRRIIKPEEERQRESVSLKHADTRESAFYKGRDYGASSIVTRNAAFASILGKFKKAEIEKPGLPSKIKTAAEYERERTRSVYDQKRGQMARIAKKPTLRATDATSMSTRDATKLLGKVKAHKMKPRWFGYLSIYKSSIVPDSVLRKQSRFFFVLDGLPQNTNVKKRESDHLKDREGEPLVPSLFFFENEAKFKAMIRAIGALNTRSIAFQKSFALYCSGILQLHCRGFGDTWPKTYRRARELIVDLSVDQSWESIALVRAKTFGEKMMFCIGRDEVTIIEAESAELQQRWFSKIDALLKKRQARVRRETIPEAVFD